MAQPKEMKQDSDNNDNNSLDTSQVYCTNAIIKKVGRAMAIDLNQCMLPGNAKNKHMTVWFRKSGKWTQDEIELVSKETDNWVKQKYGSVQTPVTFTIDNWGRKSVKILGDLNELCLHLRSTFNSMSGDDQRIPHVELFTNGPGKGGRGRGRGKGKDKDDTCRNCGELGHYKRDCPNKKDKKGKNKDDKACKICGELGHFKRDCPNKKDRKHNGNKGGRRNSEKFSGKDCGGNSEKFKEKLGKMVSKMQQLKSTKNEEILLLDEQEKQIQALLANADNLDTKALRNELKNIAKTFKRKRKEMRQRRKALKGGKRNGKGRGRAFKGHKKRLKKATKQQNKLDKQERKELNKKRKEQRKLEKSQRQKLKKEKLEKLSLARLDILPSLKTEIGNKSSLNIYVDGYNIIGCDSICRKNMRGRGGGMKKSRQRLMKLLQENFLNQIKNGQLKFDYNIDIKLWFDGNGRNIQYEDIEVTFSTKKQIVDDKLVELFSKNDNAENSNILVITTDKELTLRLHEIGVKVMKSSTFYKTYLKEPQKNNDDNGDEEKEEYNDNNDNAPDVDEDDFVQIMAKKLNYGQGTQFTDEETPEGDGGSFEEYDDETPEEAEGVNDDYRYQNDKNGEDTPDEDYDDDYEFTSIFGEDMDLINSD